MGVPKRLTEQQIKFANILVSEEGRKTATQCAIEAGYAKESARQAASVLQNPKKYPLVVQYIGELREELQKKYDVTFGSHVTELAKLRDEARAKGAWSAAGNMEIARGKAGGLYVDQKMIMTGNLDNMSVDELQDKMKRILEDHKELIDITPEVEEIESVQLESEKEKDSDDSLKT